MPSIPPLNITVTSKRRACVLDINLALSRFGLLLAQRLSEEFDLWIVLDLWRILDNPECYINDRDSMLPVQAGLEPEEAKSALGQWCLARLESDLAGAKIFWIGDALRESLLPAETDQNLQYRFETLARSLEARCAPESRGDELPASVYEAAALCAALMPYKGFILTRYIRNDNDCTPVFCANLEEKSGIRAIRVEHEETVRMEREWIMPILTRAGVTELLWAGLNLAAVHLVVPNAIFVPPPERDEDNSVWGFPPMERVCCEVPPRMAWWDNAASFWYPIN